MSIAPDANQVLLLDSNNTLSTVSTTINGLTIGTAYTISFYLNMKSGNTSYKATNFNIQVNNAIIFTLNKFDNQFCVATNSVTPAFIQYTTSPFTATLTNASVVFNLFSGDGDVVYFIDNITVNTAYTAVALSTLNTPYIPNASFELFLPNNLQTGAFGYVALPESNIVTNASLYSIPGWLVPGTGCGTVIITAAGSSYAPPTIVDGNVCIGLQLNSEFIPRIRTIITGLTPGQQYQISFYTAYRSSTGITNLVVTVDGFQVYNNGGVYYTTFVKQNCAPFWAIDNYAVLEFYSDTFSSGTDATVFIDAVTIVAMTGLTTPVIPNSSFEYIQSLNYGNTDQFYNNVVLLLHGDIFPFVDSSQYKAIITNTGSASTDTTTKMFGTSSIYYNNGTGANSIYLQTPSSANYLFGSKDFTIEFWMYLTDSSTYRGIIGNASPTWGGTVFSITTNGTNNRNIAIVTPSLSTTFDLQSTSQLTTNTWYHIAFVRYSANSTLKLYINGVVDNTRNNPSGSIDNGSTPFLRIGADGTSGAPGFKGYLDEVRITIGYARYTSNFAVPAYPFSDILNNTSQYYGANDPYFGNVTLLLHGDTSPFVDTSQNAATITNNNVTLNTGTKQFGAGSMQFTPANSSLFTTPTNANYAFGTGNFTMEYWVYPSTAQYCKILTNTNANYGAGKWSTGLAYLGGATNNAANAIIFSAYSLGGSMALQTANNTITNGVWSHVAVVRNGNTLTIYINGVSQASSTTATGDLNNGATTDTMYIGSDRGDPYFNGYLDDIRITKGVARYTSNFVIPASAFPDYNQTFSRVTDPYFPNVTLLLHGNASPFVDSSAYGATITNTLSVGYNTSTFKFGSGSMQFDTTNYLTTPSSLNYGFGTGDFTIEFWLYITNIASSPRIVGNGPWTTNAWTFLVNSPSTFGFSIFNSTPQQLFSTVSISNNTWYHVAFSKVSGVGYIAVNGTVNSTTMSGSLDGGGANIINIGWNGDSGNIKLQGYIDEFRVTKGFGRYTTNFVVPTVPFPDFNTYYASSISTSVATPTIVIPNWVTSNNVAVITGASYYGSNSLALIQTSSNISLNPASAATTIFNLIPGQTYRLQLYIFIRQYVNTTSNLKIYLNGSIIYNGINLSYSTLTSIYTNQFTATSNTATLLLVNDLINTATTVIDRINVIQTSSVYRNALMINYLPPEQNLLFIGKILTPFAYGGMKYGPINGYYIHVFKTVGTSYFTVCVNNLVCDILVVAGGGGGGADRAAGGGAGGLYYYSNQNLTMGTYTVIVGGGGFGSLNLTTTTNATNGANSSFGSLPAAVGGGAGGQYSNGSNGGSGGGGESLTDNVTNGTGGTAVVGQGFKGGGSYISGSNKHSGGGGGAGGQGIDASSAGGGNGGIGLAYTISGILTYYAGGGGGSRAFDTGTSGTSGIGGLGGGGSAGLVAAQNGYSAVPNTGGGGGGGANISQGAGGNGGSGIVIVRYPVNSYSVNQSIVQGDPYYDNVVLTLHGDALPFVDTSAYAATITNSTSVGCNTGTKQFGTGSMQFNGSTNYLNTPTTINYAFGSQNFTVECWVYFNSTTYPAQRVWSNNLTWTTNAMYLTLNAGYVYFQVNGGVSLQGAVVPISTGIWYHIALVRNGTTWSIYVNGILDVSGTNSTNADNGTSSQFYIGRCFANEFLNGFIDEFRITKGVARYTANFVVPQFAFPDLYGTQVNEYPPAALSGTGLTNTTTLTSALYGNGTYIASASSGNDTTNYPPATAFNKTIPSASDQWLTAVSKYTATSGAYAGATSTAGISGEWLQIQLANRIVLTSYILTAFSTSSGTNYLRTPYTWTILGSNDGTNWTIVDSRVAQVYSAYGQSNTYTIVNNIQSYLYYRMVIQATQINTPDTYAEVGEWRLFGY